jgi:tetratricopeptide (TPR) repeat protein
LLALLLLLPGVRASFVANLGTVAQTRAELSVYDFRTWRFQDAVRRSPEVDLAPAISRYEQALNLAPGQETALRRLGQIALSRGEYDVADDYLARAAAQRPDASVNRKLYGEILAVHGRVEEAAGQWRPFLGPDKTASVDAMSLQNRVRWHRHLGEEQIVAWMRRAMER